MTTRFVPCLFLAFLVFGTAIPAMASEETLFVPAGDVVNFTDLQADSVIVAGTLQGVGGHAVLRATSVTVLGGGAILGTDGSPGSDERGLDATSSRGMNGGDLLIQARRLSIEEGAVVRGGHGGRGGHADGPGEVTGGNGGAGGSVRLVAVFSGGIPSDWAPAEAHYGDPCLLPVDAAPPGVVKQVQGGRGDDACAFMVAADGGDGTPCAPDQSTGGAGGGGLAATTKAIGGDGGDADGNFMEHCRRSGQMGRTGVGMRGPLFS